MKNLWKFLFLAGLMVIFCQKKETVSAADFDPSAATETYDCGSATAYWYQSTGRLVFSGTGYVQNYYYNILNEEWENPPPYLSHMEEIISADFHGCFPGECCLYGASAMTSVSLPDDTACEEIRAHAFYECSSLISADVPVGVRTIGLAAFGCCGSMESISLPTGIRAIKGFAFQSCSSLRYAFLYSSVTEIGQSAFSHCSSLRELNIPAGVTSIPSSFADSYVIAASSSFLRASW